MDDYIEKPINAEKFYGIVEKYLSNSRRKNRKNREIFNENALDNPYKK